LSTVQNEVSGRLNARNRLRRRQRIVPVQSIPAPKAEPFKQWLAKVGNYSEIPNSSNSCDDNIAGEWIAAFKGGTVVVNAPAGPYKCPPGPYEYALLWAAHIKKNKLKAKVHMVDPGAKPVPPGVAVGFLKAIEANKDVLAYAPNTNILNVSAKDSMIETEAGKIKYDFLSIIPPNKTMGFIKEAGLGDPFIAVDPVTFRSKADERVFALGDNAATPYSKSAYTAAQSAKIAGAFIARAMGAKVGDPGGPHNICYPLVSMDSAIMVRADWSHGKDKDGKPAVITKGASDNDAKAQLLMLRREWEKGLLREMFGA